MSLETYLRAMPKVELHVHLEGAIQPATLLELARRNQVPLPADTEAGLRRWYTFTDFPHFAEIYQTLSRCLRTADDLELITRDFLAAQAAQNIRHTEATYTALTVHRNSGLSFEAQLAAINRARAWAERELNTTLGLIIDIPREWSTPAEGEQVAEWAIAGHGQGVAALGLGGYEVGFPPELFAAAFARAHAAGLPAVLHAGETEGPASIWSALEVGRSRRLGHGVRCLEDARLVDELRRRQIPLEVCPSSNVCLKVVPDWAAHPLPALLRAGLNVTLNSDDPPMFSTTLTDEYRQAAAVFGLGAADLEQLVLNAVAAALRPEAERRAQAAEFRAEFARLRRVHGVAE